MVPNMVEIKKYIQNSIPINNFIFTSNLEIYLPKYLYILHNLKSYH